jgi:hypothetical protein
MSLSSWRRPIPWDTPIPARDGDTPRDGSLLCCKINGRSLDLCDCNCKFRMCDDCIVYNFPIPSSMWEHPINANADVHYKFNSVCAGRELRNVKKRVDGNRTIQ